MSASNKLMLKHSTNPIVKRSGKNSIMIDV